MLDNDEEYNELSKYASLDGTETGGYVCELLCLNEWQTAHGMTPEFRKSLDKELDYWLDRFRQETRVQDKVIKVPDRTVQELVWIDITNVESK